ncbi:unnamed protein product [Eruca vesicaria subsp. sativa]|uniref:RRM domain-containing protein n=1 Tax=Eruca vesicaria subsp. sativa TaxID=29727 RepID=A0ABC8IVG3_ERUVS|nr:unnamed protein product [Eruca vesicaria subsp. sativa]
MASNAQYRSSDDCKSKKRKTTSTPSLSRYEKGTNLYVKNIDDIVNDEKLKEMFAEFGDVTSSKTMLSHMRPNAPMGGFHHPPTGGPAAGPHHQMYMGQKGQGMVPSQPMGYGYQLQFMPGVRPGLGPANFMMPYIQSQTQPDSRVGFRRGAPYMKQHFQHQQPHNGRYMGGVGNMLSRVESSVPQGIIRLDASAVSHNASQNQQRPPLLPISKLTSAVALANPANHSQILIKDPNMFTSQITLITNILFAALERYKYRYHWEPDLLGSLTPNAEISIGVVVKVHWQQDGSG